MVICYIHINLPTLERDGYTFLGWYVGEEKIDSNYKFGKTTILSAKWENINKVEVYIVSFDSEGGTVIEDQTVKKGEKVVKPENPIMIGYTFKEWQLNGKVYDFNTPVTSDITLYAKWSYDTAVAATKPIIYLYPEKKMDITVKLGNLKDVTTIYPKYNNGWNVTAYPSGKLIDKNTGRSLYSLYWEGKNFPIKDVTEGFVVKGEDTIDFLEEKLEILGLNEREAEEFIIYWLPQMEHNKYNFIRFADKDEIDKYMPLEITPKPDTVIRILMEFKPLDKKIEVKEQKLTKIERIGYTAVEWGGSVINQAIVR